MSTIHIIPDTNGTGEIGSSSNAFNTVYVNNVHSPNVIKNLSASGATITYTKGDGTTDSVKLSGEALSGNVTVTKSTMRRLEAYDRDTISVTDSRISAGTYTLQELLQKLVTDSHYHGYCNCDCSDCD